MAKRADRRRDPVFEDDEEAPDRLDLRLRPEDRPTAGRGPVRRGPPREVGRGRIEPTLYIEERPLSAQRDDDFDRPRRRERVARDEEASEMTDAPEPRRPRRGGSGRPPGGFGRFVRRAFYWGFVLMIWGAIGVGGIVLYYGARLPPTSEWAVPKRPANVKIVSADGKLVGNRGDTGGEAVKIKDLPPWLPGAVIAIEDRRFRDHFGIDPIGLARAVVVNLTARGVSQGGSTLTQQLAKNLFLTQERTFGRKVQEVLLALWLEHTYTKDQILELYLNRVYMGAGAYGVDAAARRYFGKSARDVTPMEAAMLAGLLKAPSRYAPSRDPDRAKARAQTVLAAMVETGVISEEQRQAAIAQPRMIFTQPNSGSENYVADWVMDQVPSYIGSIDKDIVVETTIDSSLQILAEAALQAGMAQFGDKKDVSQGAIVSLDPNGAVKALVGGIDYTKSQFNRAVAAKRQPGSAFKPFVYLTAMEHGLTPDTVRDDTPFTYKGWSPKNYEKEFRGPVTLKDALAHSINTVAAKLAIEVGPKNVAETAMRLGITSPLMATPSIALGTSEVTPLEITGAYVPFSNGGQGVVPHVITTIRGADGKILYKRKGTGIGRVIEPVPLAEMNTMLAETLATGTGRKAQIPGWPAAGKTGTSQDFRDAWFIGYTGLLTTGVWLGNDDGAPTKRGTGGTLAAVVWQRFMLDAHRGRQAMAIPGTTGRAYARDDTGAPDRPAPQDAMSGGRAEAIPMVDAGRQVAVPLAPPRPRARPADPETTGSLPRRSYERDPQTLGEFLGGLFGR
ncbi:transglycosylase domain-containing protein [Pinisolibacter aquiterrae]|uniref:transglycosylase domain-containing protein n=1 Tax=Pinisolibacter aquiterrae TaxID=2815579 RepID=UPI003B75BB57